jgi:ubiquinone/menaquinone biosynthesis C-methylase UbiE
MATLEEIKASQRRMWASGDYAKIAWGTVPLSDALVEAVELRPGAKVLDVATGTGHVALAAARRFCTVVGVDFVPALLEVARRRAAAEGLEVTFVEGDAENLPCPDGDFDYVLSAIGVMFAPNQEKAARELLRATRAGGTIGLLNWTSTGLVSELFKTIAKYVPPPSELKPAMLWGSEERVHELLGHGVSSLTFRYGKLRYRYLSPEHYVDFFLTWYGPIRNAAESLAEPVREMLRTDLIAFARRFNSATDGTAAFDVDYMIVIATKK